jgi:hypothetical protein
MICLQEEAEMTKKYIVKLSNAEHEQLKSITTSGVQRVRKVMRANILLNANAGWLRRKQAIKNGIRLYVFRHGHF